jgi:hypothetical protein
MEATAEYTNTAQAGADPFSDRKVKRLRKALEHGRTALKPFRDERIEAIRQYVGFHYSKNGAKDHVPVNLIELAASIYMRSLAAKAPDVSISTSFQELKSMAYNLELGTNHLIQKIKFGKTIKAVVLEALLSPLGILKCGLNAGMYTTQTTFTQEVGQPFCELVTLDDWVHDGTARVYEEVQFAGNRYRIPLDNAKENENFDEKERNKLTATARVRFSEDGSSRADDISRGEGETDEYIDFTELWELWCPMDNIILTLPLEGSGKPLEVKEWEGPDGGLYHLLGFTDVPGNLMPLAPVSGWRDLHDLANSLFRKLHDQAMRQKTITKVRRGAEKDGERTVAANDGDVITSDDPSSTVTDKHGGIDQSNFGFFLQTKDLFSWRAGNLDIMGGLSPQADTFGQEKLLDQSSSKRINEMQDRVYDFVQPVIRDLAWYLWTDPLIELPLVKPIAGTDININHRWTPEERAGDFLDYNLKIVANSMQVQTPAMKSAQIKEWVQTMLVPLGQQMQAQGMGVNFEGLFRTLAKYDNLDDLDDLIIFMQQQMQQPGPVGQPPAKAAMTTRRYERVNRPGATRQGADQALISSLMGGNPQQAELEAIGRPQT